MKKFSKKACRLDGQDNRKTQPKVDEAILLQMQKKKEEQEALKKMLGNLTQLQNLNKQHNRNK